MSSESVRPKAILYARVSLVDLNPANQILQLNEYAQNKGIDVIASLVDHGVSGVKKKPQLEVALKLLASGQAEYLLVAAIDRIGRDLSSLIITVKTLIDGGCTVVFLREGLTLKKDDPSGALILNIFASLASWERQTLIERTRLGLARARAEGKILGRPKKISSELEAEVLRLHSQSIPTREIARRIPALSRGSVQGVLRRHKLSEAK